MNRRQKIIVSVTGIFLVLLILVGLTYAYFLTQIQGNDKSKSISVSTANLALVYRDGNGIIEPDEAIIPGTTIESKTFTVKNEGNDTTEYVVVIEDVVVTNVSTGVSTTFESNDFVYTLTCTSDGADCNSINTEATFPMAGGILIGNSVEVGKTHSYTLTVTYKDSGIDQSADMNKTLTAKVNIKDPNGFNPYVGDKGSLAYTIINNAVTATTAEKEAGYAEYRPAPLTTPASGSTMVYTDNGLGTETSKTFNSTNAAKYYMTYGDTYKFDAGTGTYTIANKNGTDLQAILISTGYETLKGKYIVSNSGSTNATAVSGSAKTTIYYVTDATISSGTVTIKTKPITKKTTEDSYGSAESTLTTTADEYGTSYYYRGDVENNYLTFNNGNNDTCWRIVRIEGDGSIKIVLADATAGCSTATLAKTDSAYIGTGDYGYTDDYKADYENSKARTSSMKYKFNIFLNGGNFDSYNLSTWTTETKTYTAWSADAKRKLKTTTACIGDTTTKYDYNGAITTSTDEYYFDSYVRLNGKGQTANATLMCNATGGKTSETQIFPLTADEVVFAGGKAGYANYTYYLRDNATTNYWWTLSPALFDSAVGQVYAFIVGDGGYVVDYIVSDAYLSLRPAVSLVSGTQFDSGDGSINSPYKIK